MSGAVAPVFGESWSCCPTGVRTGCGLEAGSELSEPAASWLRTCSHKTYVLHLHIELAPQCLCISSKALWGLCVALKAVGLGSSSSSWRGCLSARQLAPWKRGQQCGSVMPLALHRSLHWFLLLLLSSVCCLGIVSCIPPTKGGF